MKALRILATLCIVALFVILLSKRLLHENVKLQTKRTGANPKSEQLNTKTKPVLGYSTGNKGPTVAWLRCDLRVPKLQERDKYVLVIDVKSGLLSEIRKVISEETVDKDVPCFFEIISPPPGKDKVTRIVDGDFFRLKNLFRNLP